VFLTAFSTRVSLLSTKIHNRDNTAKDSYSCVILNYLIIYVNIDFSQHNNKLTTIIFIVYSDMFRLT